MTESDEEIENVQQRARDACIGKYPNVKDVPSLDCEACVSKYQCTSSKKW